MPTLDGNYSVVDADFWQERSETQCIRHMFDFLPIDGGDYCLQCEFERTGEQKDYPGHLIEGESPFTDRRLLGRCWSCGYIEVSSSPDVFGLCDACRERILSVQSL